MILTPHKSLWKPVLGRQIAQPDPGLVGYWLLNENGGNLVHDLSGNRNHGTITGATWVSWKFGPCLSFDGSGDYVSVGDPSIVDFGVGNFAISIWYARANAFDKYSSILGKDASGQRQLGFEYQNQVGAYWGPTLTIGSGTTTWTNYIGNSYGNDTLWHHVVCQRVGNTVEIYFDGISRTVSTVGTALTMVSGTAPLWFGARSYTGSNQYFNGQISSVEFYNRALTPAEIRREYEDPYWRFRREPIELWTAAMVGGGSPPTFKPAWAVRRRQTIGSGVI